MGILMLFRRSDPNAPRSEGCGYWLIASIASLLMLCVNIAVVQVVYVMIRPFSSMLAEPRVAQAAVLIVPATMLFVEWWLWEVIIDWWIRDPSTIDKRKRRR